MFKKFQSLQNKNTFITLCQRLSYSRTLGLSLRRIAQNTTKNLSLCLLTVIQLMNELAFSVCITKIHSQNKQECSNKMHPDVMVPLSFKRGFHFSPSVFLGPTLSFRMSLSILWVPTIHKDCRFITIWTKKDKMCIASNNPKLRLLIG